LAVEKQPEAATDPIPKQKLKLKLKAGFPSVSSFDGAALSARTSVPWQTLCRTDEDA
jgi:hypothetical protein